MTRRSTPRRPLVPVPAPALVLTLSCLILASLALGCQSPPAEDTTPEPAAPPPPPVEAVATVRQIMDAMVIPTSAAIWNAAGEAPADDEAWKQLRNAAVQLTEAGNLLLIGDRALDDDVWRETSVLLRTGGAQALAAVEERDVEGVVDAGNVMIDSCEICHERHLSRE